MDKQPVFQVEANEKPPTAAQMAGRLTAKELEPLVRYVERATGAKLLRGARNPHKPAQSQQ